ncbi:MULTISPECIES: hypothetical protein [unclassified Mesorhizobium]|uniref:hypothetical protein n=1 Tax=unclassified Mesorhizobium TaxID=325217 RepID=UPI0012EC9F63|nr:MULTISPECIES: hypothetical protein [unclassified Mesorhizobium]
MANAASSGMPWTRKNDNSFRRRFVVCGSMAFAHKMDEICSRLAEHDVLAVAPDDVDAGADFSEQKSYQRFKKEVSKRHIKKVRDPRTIGIVVANFEKHGTRSYIGANTFAEIAIAFADNKAIFLLDGIPRNFSDELSAWGVHDLRGSLDPLIFRYRDLCRKDLNQLRLPCF